MYQFAQRLCLNHAPQRAILGPVGIYPRTPNRVPTRHSPTTLRNQQEEHKPQPVYLKSRMPFQRFVKFAATVAGYTVITSSTVLIGVATNMVDNHIGRDHSVNNVGKKIEKLGEKVDRNQAEILLSIQQTSNRTMKGLMEIKNL